MVRQWIKSIQDLNGKKVGGQIGTSGLIETLPKAKVKAIVKTYDEIGLALEDLSNGSLDAELKLLKLLTDNRY